MITDKDGNYQKKSRAGYGTFTIHYPPAQIGANQRVDWEISMSKTARPITFTLTASEAAELLTPAGAGGQQTFQQQIINQLQGGNLEVSFDDDQLGKLIRYMTQYGPGGFQGRLRKAFRRPLLELIAA